MDIENTVPVVVTLTFMQIVKVIDKDDKLKAFYPLIAIVIGFAIGWSYGVLSEGLDPFKAIWTAIVTTGGAQLAWATKEAVMKPIGAAIPGDPKKGA